MFSVCEKENEAGRYKEWDGKKKEMRRTIFSERVIQ